ncbi:dTDP-4-dehydrorhamnose reductase [Candidatus Villigracilis saccharophilus]|uniref:dTDP-4-dehydrorhamnose reductase n=1 Tax=Candidatus Villigracilis saccharophilus TaxID=3140684 RepID=UPI003136567F|nr:dTDP-4-dehydrorhamnose reductase [Anaerolineales bacterium]
MMRIFILAENGQLGWELCRTLAPLGEIIAVDYPKIDLERPETVCELIREIKPALVVNAAAYTAVDLAETERERAAKINAIAPGLLAEECNRLGAMFFHYSTDYVFDGTKGSPYIESDTPNPLSVYGRSKLEGEQLVRKAGGAHLIFRTSWVYSMRGQGGFISKVMQWSRRQETLRMVTDQIGNPTWARMLAEVAAQIAVRGQKYVAERSGLYHLAGSGFASRLEWAKMILELDPNKQEQITKEILPALTADFPTPAERPLFSALDCSKFESTFDLKLPGWQSALKLAMQ